MKISEGMMKNVLSKFLLAPEIAPEESSDEEDEDEEDDDDMSVDEPDGDGTSEGGEEANDATNGHNGDGKRISASKRRTLREQKQ